MALPTLVHIPQSAWSEKARWALEHHVVPTKSLVHVPMVYEPLLRVMGRDLLRKPTVPMLLDGRFVARDSLEIARWAEERGKGSPLFPRAVEAEVLAWNEAAERLMQAARARLVERLLASDAALLEAVPPPLSMLGRAALPLARLGTGFIASKHVSPNASRAETEAAISRVLEEVEAALAGREYLAGDGFTFADIAVGCAVNMIAPHARQPLGPASREVWAEPAIAACFPSVVAYRDRIVEHHR
ncbi:MAG: glutathione S-transferase family protein [Polyangiaceae bacterium]|nr:glutathione S-transferase family protein [Polyangiaceae bacterium]MBK8936392.1 glutathione S-transferase family protein [Polyangiaceae bacterium]